ARDGRSRPSVERPFRSDVERGRGSELYLPRNRQQSVAHSARRRSAHVDGGRQGERQRPSDARRTREPRRPQSPLMPSVIAKARENITVLPGLESVRSLKGALT